MRAFKPVLGVVVVVVGLLSMVSTALAQGTKLCMPDREGRSVVTPSKAFARGTTH